MGDRADFQDVLVIDGGSEFPDMALKGLAVGVQHHYGVVSGDLEIFPQMIQNRAFHNGLNLCCQTFC